MDRVSGGHTHPGSIRANERLANRAAEAASDLDRGLHRLGRVQPRVAAVALGQLSDALDRLGAFRREDAGPGERLVARREAKDRSKVLPRILPGACRRAERRRRVGHARALALRA
jgi:hypothetical protein